MMEIHVVAAADSPEFARLCWALRSSPVVGLDAEWKPNRTVRLHHQDTVGGGESAPAADLPARSFPNVSLLQIACRVRRRPSDPVVGDSPVFLVDLLSVPLVALWGPLRDMFESSSVIKLGFRFKQDLVYLSSTFSANGCDLGFDRVEPFMDITSIYHHLKNPTMGKKHPKDTKSLAAICKEVLNVSLSKELQCSDWSRRPLSEQQILYAAADAYYLLEIFDVFQQKIIAEEPSVIGRLFKVMLSCPGLIILELCEHTCRVPGVIIGRTHALTSAMLYDGKSQPSPPGQKFIATVIEKEIISESSSNKLFTECCESSDMLDDCLSNIVRRHGEKIMLKESDRKPRTSRRKEKKQSSGNAKHKEKLTCDGDWQGPPPWDVSFGGDGSPKFLCDVMIEGLAKHLRCVGIDAAIPFLRKPDPRQLLNQAYKEKRVLLTRDAKLLRYQYLVRNQVYKVKSSLKNDQLLEIIETFQLKISEEQLMSRCTKCNGNFIQKPLTIEEAIAASRGFQVIPDCLFDRNLEFWQCTDCKQLYWEGTQYRNAVQKFVAVCKLND